jgi:hypothetical protein
MQALASDELAGVYGLGTWAIACSLVSDHLAQDRQHILARRGMA